MTKTEKTTASVRIAMAAALVGVVGGLISIFGVVFYAGALTARVEVNERGIAEVKDSIREDIKSMKIDINAIESHLMGLHK